MESRTRLDIAEVEIQLESMGGYRRTNRKLPHFIELSKRIRISLRNYQNLITELTQAGMLERLSPKTQPAVFQLYPMPFDRSLMPRGSQSDLNGSKAKLLILMAITGIQTTSNTDACWTTTSPSRDGNAAVGGNT